MFRIHSFLTKKKKVPSLGSRKLLLPSLPISVVATKSMLTM